MHKEIEVDEDETTGEEVPTAQVGPVAGGAAEQAAGASPNRRRLFLRNRDIAIAAAATLVIAGSILGASALSGPGASRHSDPPSILTSSHGAAAGSGATITVTGSGQVEGTPDTATFQIGVQTTAATAAAALDQNNTQVAALEQSLEQDGVPLKDIQTSWLNLSANTNSNGDVTGFTANDDLSVTMTNLAGLGSALDDAVHAAGNGATLGGISFSISNQSKLLAAARAQAMLEADTEASQLASGAGLALGPVLRVTDQENAGQQVFYSPTAFAAANGTASVPVQAGQQPISVQVTVVYQLVSASS